MRKLDTLDSAFLRLETGNAHMHVGWLAFLELPQGETLEGSAIHSQIAERLHLTPRFRQRIVEMPLEIGGPAWRDDPGFDLREHVRSLPGGRTLEPAEVHELADRFLSRPLSRDRALWEILVVPSVTGGRAALLGKVHHAMVDGIAAVELGTLLFDVEPSRSAVPDGAPELLEWEPEPGVSPLRLAASSVAQSAVDQLRSARTVARLGLSPRKTMRMAESMRRAAFHLAEDALNPAPSSFLNVPIGPGRALATGRLDLRRLLAVKQASGAKLNDVVLAVCAGALRSLTQLVGEPEAPLRIMVPVNVRGDGDGDGGHEGNRITFGFVELPVAEADPLARLAEVRLRMNELKGSGRIAGSEMLMQGLGALPGPLKDRAARLAGSPKLFNLTVSNVPGPRIPLFAGCGRVSEIYPVIPVTEDHAISIGVLTYEDAAHFAIYGDPEALPEMHVLPDLLDGSLEELEVAVVSGPGLAPDGAVGGEDEVDPVERGIGFGEVDPAVGPAGLRPRQRKRGHVAGQRVGVVEKSG